MAATSPRMLADRTRVEQLMLLGQTPGLLRGNEIWTDHEAICWAGKRIRDHWFAVCSVGPGWIFDPRGQVERAEELARRRDELSHLSPEEIQDGLRRQVGRLRLGNICERVYWSIHRRLLECKRSLFLLPDVQLRQHLWGGEPDRFPQHWRTSITGAMETLSWLHLWLGGLANDRPPLGRYTALLTHFADLRGSPADHCEDDCPVRGGIPHSHFLVNVGCGFLGYLEECCVEDDENGGRRYEFPALGSRETGTSLRRLGRTGRLMSMYLPARLGEPERCKTQTPNQHRLLQAIVRETTRRRRKQRRSHSEPEIVENKLIPNAQGRVQIECPLLTDQESYIGFNGNGTRRGCGYRLCTDGGWLAKAGYEVNDLDSFLDDLASLTMQLGLTVVGLLPGTNPVDWLGLDRMRGLARQPRGRSVLRRLNLRIYAATDCFERWKRYFGWPYPSLLFSSAVEVQSAQVSRLLEQTGVTQAALAAGIGMDASLLSKVLHGRRRCPLGFADRVQDWFNRRDCTVAPVTENNSVRLAAPSDGTTVHLDLALAYLRRGWSIIPQVPGKKQPFVPWKCFQDRRPTEEDLRQWWRRWPDAGIALIAGPLSGVLVVDVDGTEAHEELVTRLGSEPIAPKVFSGSREPNRYHLFFQHPELSTRAKKTPWHPKLEFRGHAGLAVLPPSLHRSGHRYAWGPGRSLDDLSLPDLPSEIVSALTPTPRRVSEPTGVSSTAVVLTGEVSPSTQDFLSGIYADAGGWNGRLFRAAADLAGRGVPFDRAEPQLLAGARPWDAQEEEAARRTIASAYSQPRTPAFV